MNIKYIYNIHSRLKVGMEIIMNSYNNIPIHSATITEISECKIRSHDVCDEGCLRKRIGINGSKPRCMIYGNRTNGFKTTISMIPMEDFIMKDEFEI